MPTYTLKEHPEVSLIVPGSKDSKASRQKAMEQAYQLLDEQTIELPNGLTQDELILAQEPQPTESVQAEVDEVSEAVQSLHQLIKLKTKVEQTREEALQIRELINLLFSDARITDEQLEQLRQGLKVLSTFAQANVQYKQARVQAESARKVLDLALKSE
jgi:hypothetical protein